MKPPSRLLDDPNLAADLRSDLQTVVRHPYACDLERAGTALAAAIGGSLAASSAQAASAPTSAAAAASGGTAVTVSGLAALPIALKITLAAVGGAAVLGLAAVQLQPSAPLPQTASTPAAPQTARLPTASPQPTAATPPPMAAGELAPEAPQPTAASSLGPSASRREIGQLRRIQRLLASDPAAAYRLAQASQREFPDGALREEREGLAVIALFQLDRSKAAREAERFLGRHPHSPLAERIRKLAHESAP